MKHDGDGLDQHLPIKSDPTSHGEFEPRPLDAAARGCPAATAGGVG